MKARTPPIADTRSDWQKEQGARCGCRGSDEMCPCQNIERGSWFQETRLEWMFESIQIFGYLNREHVKRKFEISEAQSALDFREAKRRWPAYFQYNPNQKRYEARS